MPKKRILLCWGYHRKGWLHAFNVLNDEFEFHYLFHITKPVNDINHSLSKNLHYWTDFNSAQQLLQKIKPDKVVFMGVEGANVIALNIVAKQNGIETIVMQHGMFHTYEDYLNLAKEEKKQRIETGNQVEVIGTNFLLKFFLKSLWWHLPALLHIWRLRKNKQKYLEVEALKKSQSKLRHADKYIVFTKHNASIYSVRDGVKEDKLIEVGNPEMDDFFENSNFPTEDKFYLLIDQPWSGVKDFNSPGFGVTIDQSFDFHKKLANHALDQNAKLFVKLHPYSYQDEAFQDNDNLIYLRDVSITDHIKSAIGVYGFSSTLMLASIAVNKCCLFKIWQQSNFQDEMMELGVAVVLDYNSFKLEDISFKGIEDGNSQEFVRRYLYKSDGKSIERIKQVLEQ